jgi:hypothetical protein
MHKYTEIPVSRFFLENRKHGKASTHVTLPEQASSSWPSGAKTGSADSET